MGVADATSRGAGGGGSLREPCEGKIHRRHPSRQAKATKPCDTRILQTKDCMRRTTLTKRLSSPRRGICAEVGELALVVKPSETYS